MIRSVEFSSFNIRPGEDITILIDATYPVTIVINCFVTKPPPPRYVPCPHLSKKILSRKQPFIFSTSEKRFKDINHIEFMITDAEADTQIHVIEIEIFNSLLGLA